MAKTTIQYVCSSCGAKAPQLLGRCPVCGEWGTYEEEVIVAATNSKIRSAQTTAARPQLLQDIEAQEESRIDVHNGEFNRVLGGGLVPGSLVLLGGEPGIGKSTLALQVLMQQGDRKTLYAVVKSLPAKSSCAPSVLKASRRICFYWRRHLLSVF